MKHKKTLIGMLMAAMLALPGNAQAAQDIDIYYPEEGRVLLAGEEHRIRFNMNADAYSFQAGAAFTRPGVSAEQAFSAMVETDLNSRAVGNGEDTCHSIRVNAGKGFGAGEDGQYWLWVFAIRPDKSMIAGGYMPVEIRSAPRTSRSGWFTESGLRYYGREGRLLTGWQEFGLFPITTRRYYFDENGVMSQGWIKYDNKWYYLNADGLMQTGWLQSNADTYYLDPLDGHMYTHWHKLDGAWYYFHPDSGKMQQGWQQLDGRRYYLHNGQMHGGWQLIADGDGKASWFYFQEEGSEAQDSLRVVDGARYHQYPDGGEQLSGWQQIPAMANANAREWYYLYEDGGFATGWQRMGGATYYFGSTGAMQTGWVEQDGETYYLNPISGIMLTGIQTIDGQKHDFGPDGKLR